MTLNKPVEPNVKEVVSFRLLIQSYLAPEKNTGDSEFKVKLIFNIVLQHD